jgi:hypothetical protein
MPEKKARSYPSVDQTRLILASDRRKVTVQNLRFLLFLWTEEVEFSRPAFKNIR